MAPAGHAWAATPPAWSCPPPPFTAKPVIKHRVGRRGLTEIVSLWVAPYCKGPSLSPQCVLGGKGESASPLKSPSRNQQPAAWEGRGSERRGDRQRPQGTVGAAGARRGLGGGSGARCRPSSRAGARRGGRGPRVWALLAPPHPRRPTASLPRPAPRRWGPRPRPALTGLPRPRPLQQPLRGPHVLRLHRLHQLLLLPHGAAGPAATRRSVLSAVQTQRQPRVSDRILSSPRCLRRPPPAAQRRPRVRVRARTRARAGVSGSDWGWGSDAEGRIARHGRGAARGREPATVAGTRWRAASEPPPGRLGPLPRPLTSVSPRRPRARLRGSAPALALPPPDAPSPRLGARVRLGLCGQRGTEDDRRGQRTVRRGAEGGLATEHRHGGDARLNLGEVSRGCGT